MADNLHEVVVTDVKIPFWSLVMLMVKLAIAAIPALIILMIIGSVVSIVMAAIFGGGMGHWAFNRFWMR